MTTPKEWARAKAEEAAQTGMPIPRMAAPGVALPRDAEVLFAQHSRGRLPIAVARSQQRMTAAPEDVPSLLGLDAEDGQRGDVTLVFPDRTHTARLMSTLRQEDSLAAHQALSVVDVATSLPASTRVLVLTDALSRKYHLPAPLDPGTFASWTTAFGLGAHSLLDQMRELLGRATRGAFVARQSDAASICRSEFYLLSAARYSSPKAAVSTFSTLTAITAVQAMLDALDPLLLERNLLDGTVAAMRVTGRGPSLAGTIDVEGVLDQPFRFKESSFLYGFAPLPDGGVTRPLEARLLSVEASGQHLEGTVGLSSSRATGLLDTVAAPGAVLYLSERAYRSRGGRKSRGRWMTRAASEPVPHRDVPVDVAIAGAPGAAL